MADIPFPLLVALGVVGIVILAFIGNFVAHNFEGIMKFFGHAFIGLVVVGLVALILFGIWRRTQGEIHTAEETQKKGPTEGHVENGDAKKAGVAAYHAGEYGEAYRLLKPLAEQGDADAQAYVRFISEKDRVGDK